MKDRTRQTAGVAIHHRTTRASCPQRTEENVWSWPAPTIEATVMWVEDIGMCSSSEPKNSQPAAVPAATEARSGSRVTRRSVSVQEMRHAPPSVPIATASAKTAAQVQICAVVSASRSIEPALARARPHRMPMRWPVCMPWPNAEAEVDTARARRARCCTRTVEPVVPSRTSGRVSRRATPQAISGETSRPTTSSHCT